MAKLKMEAYKKADFVSKIGSFTAQFNPSQLSQGMQVDYARQQAPGSSGSAASYWKSPPRTLGLTLLFDASFRPQDGAEPPSVAEQVNAFKDLVASYNGNIHRPNFIKLSWGNFIFKGQLRRMDLRYTLFRKNGEPLRAEAAVTFVETLDTSLRLREENKSSPDLTHVYTVKEGDTLPNIAQEIYDDPSYYIEVAMANGLDSFRRLEPGTQLVLPPIQR